MRRMRRRGGDNGLLCFQALEELRVRDVCGSEQRLGLAAPPLQLLQLRAAQGRGAIAG